MGSNRDSSKLHGLMQAALVINSPRGLDDCLQALTDQARAIIGAHMAVTSFTRDHNWGQAITATSLSEAYAAYRDYDRSPTGEGIYRLVCEQNRSFRLTQAELEAHPAWRAFGEHAAEHPTLRGWLAVPLVDREGANIGLIQLSDKIEGEFDEHDEAVLVQLAQMAAIAIENSRLLEQLQRQASEAEAREEHFRRALASAETGTWELDLLSGKERWSDQIYRLYGVTPEEVPSSYEAWLELVHPDDRAPLFAETNAIVAERRERFVSEFRIVNPQRGVRWMLSRGRLLYDAGGEPQAMTGTVVDITDRKLVEEALEESRQREVARAAELEAVMEAVPALVWIAHDVDASRITGSRASYEFLRLPWGENASKSAPEAATDAQLSAFRVLVDGVELAPEALPVQRAARGEEVRDFEEEVVFEDGSSFHLFGHATPLRAPDGSPQGAVGVFVDITERKRIEAELSRRTRQQAVVVELGRRALVGTTLQELMDQAVVQLVRTLGVTYCSVLERIDGEEGDEEVLRLRAGSGWNAALRERRTVRAAPDSLAGRTLRASEVMVVSDHAAQPELGGSQLLREHGVVSSLSVAIPGEEEGKPWGVLGVHTTERREFGRDDVHFIQAVANVLAEGIAHLRYERALEGAREELERRVEERTAQLQAANRELETFAYSVSHDLRAPLRGIDGFSQVLVEEYGEVLDETGRGYLERVRSAARRMGDLIDDLLDLSRLTRSSLDQQPVDLSAVAERVVADLREKEPEREVAVEIQPGIVSRGDERLLTVVLENLLGNAWKFTRRVERPHIAFGCERSEGGAVFYVRDNGIGFDMTYADKLFAPFQRLHSPQQFEGSGIGLATVQRIVHRHRGRIWAEAEPGGGAIFFFTLGAG